MKTSRTITLYLPPNFQKSQQYSTLYLHDGKEYLDRISAAQIIDDLITQHKIEPIIAIFIPPNDRMNEYWHEANKFQKALNTELIPLVESKYEFSSLGKLKVTCGSSLGGYISLKLLLDSPKIWNGAICLSGAFQVESSTLVTRAKSEPILGKVWFGYGTFEQELTFENAILAAWFGNGQKNIKFVKRNEGHNWTAWKKSFPIALKWMFPAKTP